MAEKKEIEILEHLLEVEKNAEILTLDAQSEADKRIGLAKSKADEQFKLEFTKLVSEYESNYENKIKEIDIQSKLTIKDFEEKVLSYKKTRDEFNDFLEKILFA